MISLLYPDAMIIKDGFLSHILREKMRVSSIHDPEDKRDALEYIASMEAAFKVLEREITDDRRRLTGLDKAKAIMGGAAVANDPANIGEMGDVERIDTRWPISDPGDC